MSHSHPSLWPYDLYVFPVDNLVPMSSEKRPSYLDSQERNICINQVRQYA